MSLEDIHKALYRDFNTIYFCGDDMPEQWFIIPNPGFTSGMTAGGERIPYVFTILGRGVTPQDAYADYLTPSAG